MSNIQKRNEFIGNILSYIVKTYNPKAYQTPLLAIKKTALFFGKSHFKIETEGEVEFESVNDRGDIIIHPIELALSYNNFHYFLKHLSDFGILCLKSLITNIFYDEIDISLTVLYNPTTMISLVEETLFYKFLLFEKYNELGKLTLPFKIKLIHDNYEFSDIPKNFLSDCIYAEYIAEIGLFCFGIEHNPCKYNRLCLDWVVNYCRMYEKDRVEKWNGNDLIEVEKSIKYLIEGGDKFFIEPLKIKESNIHAPTTCTICLDSIEEKCFTTKCNHSFHTDCIIRFLSKYYINLYKSCLEGRNLTLEHDIEGNVLHGAEYEHCCPNCKSDCFKLECFSELASDNNIVVYFKNPENCIFEI